MYLDKIESNHLLNVFTCCFLKRSQAKELLSSMQHHEIHHGISYLLDHFKHLKRTFLDIDGKGIPQSKSLRHQIAIRKSRLGVSSLSRTKKKSCISRNLKELYVNRGIVPVIRVLNLVGRWKSKPPCRKDFSEFRHSVFKKPSTGSISMFNVSLLGNGFKDAVTCATTSFRPLMSKTTHVLGRTESIDGPTHIVKELYAMTEAGVIFRMHLPYIAALFDLDKIGRELLHKRSLKVKRPMIGKIAGLVDDGGLKIRMIANLVKGWQVAVSPLYSVLKAYLKIQPEIASFDQNEGARFMAAKLRGGHVISSIDIVNSTDNLERRVYEKVIDDFILLNWEELSHNCGSKFALFVQAWYLDKDLSALGYYSTPHGDLDVRYRKGQAMGRWPSKGLLDLTMLLLARSCGADSSNCRINGDDFWTSSPKVARRFTRLLKRLQIPKSDFKSFDLKRFGEFSGRLVNYEQGILPTYKGRKIDVVSDPFGPLRQYGLPGLNLIPGHLRKKIKVVANALQEDDLSEFNCQVPNCYEGFTPASSTAMIEKSSWSELWAQQVFIEHSIEAKRLEAEAAKKFLQGAHRSTRRTGRQNSLRPLMRRVEKEEVVLVDQLSELRVHSIFKRVGLERYSEPTCARLNQFVDLLNSQFVITSDGHKIHGYGSMGPIIERLRSAKVISSKQSSAENRTKVNKLSWIIKLYRNITSFARFILFGSS